MICVHLHEQDMLDPPYSNQVLLTDVAVVVPTTARGHRSFDDILQRMVTFPLKR
jgi:hypothetical protein